jgi:hypothetical protein
MPMGSYVVVIGGEPGDHIAAIRAGKFGRSVTSIEKLRSTTRALKLDATYLRAGRAPSKRLLSQLVAADLKAGHLLKMLAYLYADDATREIRTEVADISAKHELMPSMSSATSGTTERSIIDFVKRRLTGRSSLGVFEFLLSLKPAALQRFRSKDNSRWLLSLRRTTCQRICPADSRAPPASRRFGW